MKISEKKSGAVIAMAAAAAFMMAPIGAANASSSKVHCGGVNACKGHSSCKGTSNSCKGQNACKGQGFVAMTKTQCDQVGGTVATAAAPAAK